MCRVVVVEGGGEDPGSEGRNRVCGVNYQVFGRGFRGIVCEGGGGEEEEQGKGKGGGWGGGGGRAALLSLSGPCLKSFLQHYLVIK